MRESIVIAAFIGLFFFMATAAMTAIAIRYATPSVLWDFVLWGGVVGMITSVITLVLFIFAQISGRPFMWPATCINLGLCLIVGGLVWHFGTQAIDNDYVFFRVEIINPKDLKAQLPIWIGTPSKFPFENVDPWWSPWGATNPFPQDSSNPYWAIGGILKVLVPFLRGTFLYGRSISANNYQIEYDATFREQSYHFLEHLEIKPDKDGSLMQLITVRRWIAGKEQGKLVYAFPTRDPFGDKSP